MNILASLNFTNINLDKERAGPAFKEQLRVDMSLTKLLAVTACSGLFRSQQSYDAMCTGLWDDAGELLASETQLIKLDSEIKHGTATLKSEFDKELRVDQVTLKNIRLQPKANKTFEVALLLQLHDVDAVTVGKVAAWLKYDLHIAVTPTQRDIEDEAGEGETDGGDTPPKGKKSHQKRMDLN